MLEIAKKYLEKIGMKNTQYAIAKHTDRAHLHLHIIANMVDNNGQVISDSHIGLRGKKAAQQLTEAYHLIPARKKNLELTHPEALTQNEAARYKIYEVILKTLPHCRGLSDLEQRLKEQGLELCINIRGSLPKSRGSAFNWEKTASKAAKLTGSSPWATWKSILATRSKSQRGSLSTGRWTGQMIQKIQQTR
jgi:hypothetical protein